ncbi:penicillin-insensitive murein endopeptidase [Escherichia coli]|uniref:Penicillin-insensitive murein endopeptidase n=1 Tax=Escherichia coli TaxID=562 RepID=A0A376J3B1_ECOLX|nr:penicillin-insensitive murein endopeptidase [Escherichia coli]
MFIQRLSSQVSNLSLGTVLIGDMGMPAGGRFNGGHASHQTGLDVDIFLQLPKTRWTSAQLLRPQALDLVSRDGKHVVPTLWKPEIFSLIKLAAQDKDVTRIFVNPAIKQQLCLDAGTDRDWLRKVRPWFQHRAHMHVRLRCPADSLECEDQPFTATGRWLRGQNCKAGLNLQNREQQSLRRRHRLRCRLPARRYWMST